MNKIDKKGLVPELRFPEFRETEEWKEKHLDQICEVNPQVEKLPNLFVYIDLESVEAGVLLQKKIISLEGAPSRAQRLLKKGDIIFQMVRPYQKNNYFFQPKDNLDYVASTGYAQLRAHQSNMFLFQSLHNQRFVERVLVKCTGSNYPAINSTDLSEILIEIPDLKEQQKIASCLSSLDDYINAQSQKLEALKVHKNGLMQQLFPAEGETVPKLRFKEFRDAMEWIICPLKEIFTIFQGFAFSSDDSLPDGTRWLKIADISIQQMNHEAPSFLPLDFKEKYERFLVRKGDYVIALTRPFLNKKLKLAQVDEVFHESLLNQRVGKLISSKNIDFVYYLLQTSKLIIDIEKNIAGSEPPNLSAQQIEDIFTYIPNDPKEQQKIAVCLSSLDNLINSQTQKIEILKAHKKGLMQGLFPITEK